MKILKSLTFGVMSRGSQNPVLARRSKLIHRLERSSKSDWLKTRTSSSRSQSGSATKRETKNSFNCKSGYALGGVRMHSEQSGLTVRYGAKALEFEKGKSSIIVPNKDQLIATLDTVIAGVKAGELDEHLTQQAKARGIPEPRQAVART